MCRLSATGPSSDADATRSDAAVAVATCFEVSVWEADELRYQSVSEVAERSHVLKWCVQVQLRWVLHRERVRAGSSWADTSCPNTAWPDAADANATCSSAANTFAYNPVANVSRV
jgi:hypothetical protein